MKTLIIYETQAGTTQYVATLIQQELLGLGQEAELHQVSVDGSPNLDAYQTVIFGAPTYGHGNVDFKMADFLATFKPDLAGKNVAVFGLGESSYDVFCAAADILNQWVQTHGAKPLVSPLKIDGYPADIPVLKKWVAEFMAAASL